MFNNIASKYDFLNHFLSLGIDKLWRKRAIKELKSLKPKRMLDIATGTGDFALEALKINPHNIIGVRVNGLRFWLYRVAAMASSSTVAAASAAA
jgi:demethylmenaquinone methyltransferase/2-methoxy-6-polyprenyl-1,4-benzoquinol methylase